MNRYANIDCPICKKPLDDGSAIVVCPECGAPYHMECYKIEQCCIFTELHEKNEEWTAPKTIIELAVGAEQESDESLKKTICCTQCGAENPSSGLFCRACGFQLNQAKKNKTDAANINEQNLQTGSGSPFEAGFRPPNFNPMGDDASENAGNPFAAALSIKPDDDLDGFPAKEVATYVGQNASYFLPRFKQFIQSAGKMKFLNWGAFFFTGWYFIYRKMYAKGIILVLLNFVLGIPYTLMMLNSFSAAAVAGSPVLDMAGLTTANMITSIIVWGVRLFCGFFANSMYKKHVYKKMAIIKEETKNDPPFHYDEVLRKKGSVSAKLILGLAITYFAINFIAICVLLIFG